MTSVHPAARLGRAVTVTAAALCLALVPGCASSELEGPTGVEPSEAEGIEPPTGVELSNHECLVGGWSLQGEALADYLDSFGPGEDIAVTGEFTLGFTLDRYLVAPRVGVTWQNRGTATLTSLVGEAVGEYSLQDSVVQVERELDDLEFVTVAEGQRSSITNLFFSPVTSNPLVGATVVCDRDVLTITSETDADGLTVSASFERTR